MGRGMSGVGFFPGIFKTENQQVAALSGVICAAGTLYYIAFNLSVAHKLPSTFSPQWIQAQAKYRAAQNQDPISALR